MNKSLCHPTVTLPFSLLFYILWISQSVDAVDPPVHSTVQWEIQELASAGDGDGVETVGLDATDSVVVDTTLGEYYSRWSLEENAWDSKGSNHGLVIGDPVFVNKDVMENDFALSFDGVDDHVAISDDPSLEGMDQFCFSFWVKPDEHPSGPVMLIGKEMAYRVLLTSQGEYSWVIATENNPWYSEGTPISGPGKLAEGEWNHVVAGYDGEHSYLYLNGQLDAKSTLLTGDIVDNALPLTFAKGNDTNVGFFDGTLDDVRYYKTMLSDSSVQRLYNLYPLVDTTTAPPEDTISGVQWRVTEIDFSSMKAYTNSFDDVDLDVVFTHSDGTTFTVPAFWNGGNQWKVRFAPTLTGEWSYQTICSDESNTSLHALIDTFSCEPYTGDQVLYQHGFVKTTPDKRYFTYADGTPFFYLGDTHWNIPSNTYENFKTIIDKRVEQKFTVIQSEPLGAGYTLWDGFLETDLVGFARLDERFAYVAEQGLVHANSQFFFVQEMGHHLDSYTDDYLDKLSRYWVARYSAYPVMWTTAQECDNDCYVERGIHDWWDVNTNPWKKVANFVHQHDPYKHPLSAHMEGATWTVASQSSFREVPGHSWWAAQWKPTKNGQLNFSIPRDFRENGQDKPIVNYEGHYDHLATNEFGARMQGWTAFLNGMCGHGYGAIDIWLYNSTYQMDEASVVDGILITLEEKHTKWDVSLEFPAAYQMGHMHDFFDQIEWWKLIPRFDDPEWFSDDGSWYSLASIENELYVAYFYQTGLFTTSRATGTLKNLDDWETYRAQWYNPREGSYSLISSSIHSAGGSWVIPEKPDTLDWVLLLTNDGESVMDRSEGRWRLENDATDDSGSMQGTIAGDAAYSTTETREGLYSLVLDGTDDQFLIPDHPSMNDLDSFCMAFWMRFDGIPANSMILLEKGEAFRLSLDDCGKLLSSLTTTDHPLGSTGTTVQTTDSLAPGTWYHVAMGYDGSASSIYINGQLAGSSGELLSGQVLNNTNDLILGASAETGWEFFAGQLDDLIFFREMPGPEAIAELYAKYLPTAIIQGAGSVTDFDDNGIEIVFLDATQSQDADGSIVSYEWYEEEQLLGSEETLSTEFGPGLHRVMLTVTDNNGITSTDTAEIEIAGPDFSRWSLEENARDSRGDNHGILYGDPAFVTEEVMEDSFALSFDGINDHMAISDAPSLEGMEQFCFSFWVKPDGLPSDICMIMGKEMAYRVLLNNTGGISWVIATVNHPWYSEGTSISGPGKLAEGAWNHVVAGYDGSHTYLYLNSQLNAKSIPLSGPVVNNANALYFAKSLNSNITYFKGAMDDVRYFRYMLSDSSIQRLYRLYPIIDTTSSVPVDTITGDMRIGTLGYEVALFPNPAFDQVIIQGLPPRAKISLYSLQGEQLYAVINRETTDYMLDVSQFAPGLYILSFNYEGLLAVRKLIISP